MADSGTHFVTILQAFNPGEAQLVRSRLEAAGFPVNVLHELSALSMDGYALSAGGILVQVPASRAEEAMALLRQASPPDPG